MIEVKIPEMDLEAHPTKEISNINDYKMTFFHMNIPKMFHNSKEEKEHESQTSEANIISPAIKIKIPNLDMEKVFKEETIVDGFVTSTKAANTDQKEEKNDNYYVDYYQGTNCFEA